MAIRERNAIAAGLLKSESAWDVFDPPSLGGTHLAVGTYLIWCCPPTNLAFINGASDDDFGGAVLAAATASKAIIPKNREVATLAGLWAFLPVIGAGAATYQLQLVSGGNTGLATVTSNLTAAIALLNQVPGWTNPAMTVPAERQPQLGGIKRPNICMLFPGDVLQLVVAGAAPQAGAAFNVDIQ